MSGGMRYMIRNLLWAGAGALLAWVAIYWWGEGTQRHSSGPGVETSAGPRAANASAPAARSEAGADAEQVGEVGRPVGELEHLEWPARLRQHLGEARGEPGLERGPVERFTGPDRRDLGGRLVRGPGRGQAAPPWMPSTAPVVKLEAPEAK